MSACRHIDAAGNSTIRFRVGDVEHELQDVEAHALAISIMDALPTRASRKGDRVTIEMGCDAMTFDVAALDGIVP